MKRNISDYEHEIVNQILLIELCFNASKITPIESGLGSHFNCYFFNLNMSKGISTLHSLLKPTKEEISIKNYISNYGKELSKRKDYEIFIKNIDLIKEEFESVIQNTRHKVVSHLDPNFKHSDFMSGYMFTTKENSEKLDSLLKITRDFKESFFPFTNWSIENNHNEVLEQVSRILLKV